MVGTWRQEVTTQTRNAVIAEMCTQLLRLNGGADKEKTQQSVIKYERAVWTKANDKDTYLKTIRSKLLSFKQRQTPGPKEAVPVSPVVIANEMVADGAETKQGIKAEEMNDFEMVPFPETLSLNMNANPMNADTESPVAKLHEQYQQRRVEMIKAQYNETQQCCQNQLMQQNQMNSSHIQQNVPMATRQIQTTMLQLQHEMARNNLMQHHMNQQNSLIQQHYQQLMTISNQEISI